MATALQGIVKRAEQIARKRKQQLGTTHLLGALCESARGSVLLARTGVDPARLGDSVMERQDEPPHAVDRVVERGRDIATSMGHARPNASHLLLAIARDPRSAAYACLQRMGVAPSDVRDAVLAELRPPSDRPQPALAPTRRVDARAHNAQHALARETESKRARSRPTEAAEPAAPKRKPRPTPAAPPSTAAVAWSIEPPATPSPARAAAGPPAPSIPPSASLDPKRFPLLNAIGRNLSEAAAAGEIDPIVGRDREIEVVLDVLARRRAGNPILVGPPGVGKTAVVEGLARRLLSAGGGLAERVVVEVSAGALLGGTGVRGALAERLQALRQELADADGRVVLFIDEIHAIVGVEDAGESLANELKAALARGELSCIGATTDTEYARVFERDPALARRFTQVEVGEPDADAALTILCGVAPAYEAHHKVSYDASALEAAVEMSTRFLAERQLPDKAIALLDQAAARVRRRGGQDVDHTAVAEVVSEQVGVPVERLLMTDGDALLALEAHLSERVVGQEEPVRAIAEALRKGAAGFRGHRPLGSFLLLGPTGVGKTEMAKAIAELLFPGSPMTRIDMSELSESHAVARLLGSPPGYVGHSSGGQLTEAVRKRPYQLVLFDEIEKAHRDVLMALLPLLDEGRLSDARGRVVDFSNAVIVMTTNLGADVAQARPRIGFGDAQASARAALREQAIAAVRQTLAPELYNRIDEVLHFHPLGRDEVARIAARLVGEVSSLMLERHDVVLSMEPSTVDALIAAGGFDATLGARPMRRTVGRLVEARLAQALLSREVGPGANVVLRGEGDAVLLDVRAPADAAE